MNIKSWTSAQRGRSLSLANALGVSPPTVSDWCTGKKAIPVERCVAIERATNFEVTRQDLRPNDWQDIWPELAQAPVNTEQPATKIVAKESCPVAGLDLEHTDQERRDGERREAQRREAERRAQEARDAAAAGKGVA